MHGTGTSLEGSRKWERSCFNPSGKVKGCNIASLELVFLVSSPDMDGEGKGSHAAASEACEEGYGRLYNVVTDAAAAVACSWMTFSSDPLAAAVMIVENF